MTRRKGWIDRGEIMFWRALREAIYEDAMGAPMLPTSRKLAPQQVEEIRLRFAHGEHNRALADEFGINKDTVTRLTLGVVRLVPSRTRQKVRAMGMAA